MPASRHQTIYIFNKNYKNGKREFILTASHNYIRINSNNKTMPVTGIFIWFYTSQFIRFVLFFSYGIKVFSSFSMSSFFLFTFCFFTVKMVKFVYFIGMKLLAHYTMETNILSIGNVAQCTYPNACVCVETKKVWLFSLLEYN